MMVIVETPDDAAYTFSHPAGGPTSMGPSWRAQLGHFDRTGGGNASWNSAHPSKGCSQPNLIATGGNGYLYCFAEK